MVALLALLVGLGAAPARADVLWSWSFGTEAGTFVTTGTLAETAGPGVFTFVRFSVSASQIPSNVGARYFENQPAQTMTWDGAQPTQFARQDGDLTNGSNFFRTNGAFYYTLFAGPPTGFLRDLPNEDDLEVGPLTVIPLEEVAQEVPALGPGGMVLTVALLALGACVGSRGSIRRGAERGIP